MTQTAGTGLSLQQRLRDQIRRKGPLTFHDWMQAALYDKDEGYYCRSNRKRWGREGDYRTSPERSALFGATFARYFHKLFRDAGAPERFVIVEVGGGEGQFAASVLEVLEQQFAEFYERLIYVFDEIGEDSRLTAQTRLEPFNDRVAFTRLLDLEPIESGVVFSNELLDALPTHRVTLRNGELQEHFVTAKGEKEFEWLTATPSTPRLATYLQETGIQLIENQVAEVNLDVEDWLRLAAGKLNSGYLICIDYGAEARDLYNPTLRPDGTLRAFEQHRFAQNVLANPGGQDITATVDWTNVKRVCANLGFETLSFMKQNQFLLQAGLLDVMEERVLMMRDESEKLILRTGAREMILPQGLAESFEVLVTRRVS